MTAKNTLLLLLIVLRLTVTDAKAEGSRELLNGSCSNYGYIVMWDNNSSAENFATYNCPVADRLNIRCKSGDVIYYGYYDSNQDVYYRLKDPTGAVVMGYTLIRSNSTKGWISGCSTAIVGPSNLYSGDYTPLSYTATKSGDYYIEFAVNNSATTYSKRLLYFDITVVSGGKEVRGRVWSEKWDINTNSATNPFMGNLYVYSNDSVVTEIKGNSGMQPDGFTVACNSTGASNVGSITQMRKSQYTLSIDSAGGTPSAPAYAIFLNNPDSTIFPTGKVGVINSISLSGCSSSSNCIEVNVSKAGYTDITLSFSNGTSVQLPTQSVVAGNNCIIWNGLDGNGNAVTEAITIQINVTYERGLTNLPYGDVEKNTSGIMIALIRPTHDANGNALPTPLIFWDDSLLNDAANALDGEANLTGCTGGCHQWQNMGQNNANLQIINTWWYITQEESTTTSGCPIALAITLVSFSGKDSGQDNVLHWETATEENLKDYEIEKSSNGVDFVTIGTKQARNTGSNYNYVDTTVSSITGILYYRLKTVDNRNNVTYSSVIAVNRNAISSNAITIYPNPNRGSNFAVSLNGIIGNQLSVKLFSVDGRLISVLPITKTGASEISADLELPVSLSPGLYIVECLGDNGIVASHMVVY